MPRTDSDFRGHTAVGGDQKSTSDSPAAASGEHIVAEPDRPMRLLLVDDHGVARAGLGLYTTRAVRSDGRRQGRRWRPSAYP